MSKKNQNLNKIKFKNFLKNNIILLGFVGIILIIGIAMVSLNEPQELDIVCGENQLNMYYFHLTTCPHCKKQNIFNNQLLRQCSNINLIPYEMTQPGSIEKYKEMAENIEGLNPEQFPGTPLTIINDKFNIGYGSLETTGQKLIEMIETEQGVE